MYRKYFKHEKGITGLETAIILIAFVVVAAVFAYTALSAGLFSTQKSQEAVYSGLKEAQSTLELKGGVVAVAGTPGDAGTVSEVRFVVSCVLGGSPLDFTEPPNNVVVINYSDGVQTADNLDWSISKLGNADEDLLLEGQERFEITVDLTGLTTDLSVKTKFNIEILTPTGSTLVIERTTPAWFDDIMNLH
jgi:flagellin FlaB